MREPLFTTSPAGLSLAYREDGATDDGKRCGFFWLGGFKSDMTGSKAEALATAASEMERPSLRFDYSGHGLSEGMFTDCTVSDWLAEAAHMFRNHPSGPRIVIGSSMGGWLALLLLRALGEEAVRVHGIILIAPAADMTRALMWDAFTAEARAIIERDGVWHRPSSYGEPYPITKRLIEDGRQHLILQQRQRIACPVRILHGDRDKDVPWIHGKRLFDTIDGEDVRFILIKGGDHRLSTERDLFLLQDLANELAEDSDRARAL
ncbi:MAG: alpha/beta fold hydrolase [Rhizobiales bacterium]|nr:alpha/beta fold hydrolase [Hyphomicrobiales bacterium]